MRSSAFHLDMQKNKFVASIIGISFLALMPIIAWMILFVRGKQFAVRNRLRKADAIIILEGTRGNAEYVLKILKKYNMHRVLLVTSPFHQLRTYLTFSKVFQPYHIEIINYYAETGEWHPLTWFLSTQHRKLVKSEQERIKKYRA